MNEPFPKSTSFNPERFVLGPEAVMAPRQSAPRLAPEAATAMIDFWRQLLDQAPSNLNTEYGGRVLDARGFNISEGGFIQRFEVHCRQGLLGIEFHLFEVHGVNGSRRLEPVEHRLDLGVLLGHLRECRKQAAAQAAAPRVDLSTSRFGPYWSALRPPGAAAPAPPAQTGSEVRLMTQNSLDRNYEA